MLHRHVKYLIAASLFFISGLANAGLLLVEQYDDYWSTNVNDLINYADSHDASTSAYWGLIDFTDDPNGFAGDIPGSNPWPSATAAGASGTGHALNQTFFAKITGDFITDAADTYFFQTYNDDGLFLYIDGELVINDGTQHPEMRFEGSKALAAGSHSIEMYFFENGGEASLEFTVADSSGNFKHFNDPDGPVTLPTDVPEPSTLAIFALGLMGIAARKARKA